MGIVVRQSIKATVVSYVGFTLGYLNVVLLFPLFFKPEQYGLTRILIAVASIIVQFAHLGMANAIVQFVPGFSENKKKLGGFLYFTLLISGIGFFASALIIFVFKNKILSSYQEQSPLFVQYYYYVLPIAFCVLIGAIFEAFARANFRITMPAVFRDIILRLLLIIIIFAYYFKLITFTGFVQLFVLVYAIPLLLQLYYLKTLGLLHFNFDLKFLGKDLFRHIMSFSFYSMLVGSASMLVNNLDVLMLGAFLGLKATAIYSVGFYLGTVIEIPTRALSAIATPVVVDAWKKNDMDKIKELYKKSSLNQLVLGALFFIGIWANVDNILKFLPELYANAKWVIFFIALSKLIDMATGINSEIIMTSKYYRFNFYIMLLLIVLTVVTNYIFIPIYGLSGAAFAAALSMLIFNIVKFAFILIKYKMYPFSKKTLLALLIPLAVFLICSLIPAQRNFIFDIMLRSSAISVLFIFLVIRLKISDEINVLFRRVTSIIGY